jgi:molybdate transport repressor ModE-like protein
MATDAGSWHGIELRHLAALEAIATEGSFSAAAQKMGYSQSAISGQIATLERLVGVTLVTRIRGSRTVSLSREGERLLEHARVINARLSAARADVEALAHAGGEGVRIGTFRSASQTLLPDLVRKLTSGPDALSVTVHEDVDNDHLVTMLESGELDLAYVLLPVDSDVVDAVEVLRDPWVLVVRTDHPLVWRHRAVSAAELSNLPLITFEQVSMQKLVEGALRAAGANLRIASRLGDYASVLAMVSAGLGCGLVPRLAVEADVGAARLEGLRVLPIEGQQPRLIGVAANRERARDETIARVLSLAVERARGAEHPPLLSARAGNE